MPDVYVRSRNFEVNTAFLKGYGVMVGLYLSYILYLFKKIRVSKNLNGLYCSHAATASSLNFTAAEEEICFNKLIEEGILLVNEEKPKFAPIKLSKKGLDLLELYTTTRRNMEKSYEIAAGVRTKVSEPKKAK